MSVILFAPTHHGRADYIIVIVGRRFRMYCVNRFRPHGAAFAKGLTLKMGQTHVHRYLKPLFDMIKSGKIDPSFVITHIFPLDEAPEAYEIFKYKKDGCVKVVMKP